MRLDIHWPCPVMLALPTAQEPQYHLMLPNLRNGQYTLLMSCRAALAAEEEQCCLCQRACEAAEAAYSRACCRIQGGTAYLQAQQRLLAVQSQILQVALKHSKTLTVHSWSSR